MATKTWKRYMAGGTQSALYKGKGETGVQATQLEARTKLGITDSNTFVEPERGYEGYEWTYTKGNDKLALAYRYGEPRIRGDHPSSETIEDFKAFIKEELAGGKRRKMIQDAINEQDGSFDCALQQKIFRLYAAGTGLTYREIHMVLGERIVKLLRVLEDQAQVKSL